MPSAVWPEWARTPEGLETMLRKMFIGEPPSGHDPILDYSRAVTGTMFFVPSADFLRSIPNRSPPNRSAAVLP